MKPFNYEQARAGAPVTTRSGLTPTIYRWDVAGNPWPILGSVKLIGDKESVVYWCTNGKTNGADITLDLMMAPCGTLDGRDVYPGDELINKFGQRFIVGRTGTFTGCKWPTVYPEVQWSDADASELWADAHKLAFPGPISGANHIANFAIRHGIDNGYLIDARVLEPLRASLGIDDPEQLMGTAVTKLEHAQRDRERLTAVSRHIAKAALFLSQSPMPPHPYDGGTLHLSQLVADLSAELSK